MKFRKTRPAPEADLQDTPEAIELEHQARHQEAMRVIRRALLEESLKEPEVRDVGRVDLALDLKSILAPAPVGSTVVQEMPPVAYHYGVPVVPGRTS